MAATVQRSSLAADFTGGCALAWEKDPANHVEVRGHVGIGALRAARRPQVRRALGSRAPMYEHVR
ncbi:hypothetical protein [Streptomyces bluensis]|uniref:hypothetical protein n=1 Tax=Streptomyces bluensis TaxID=33897 RepID=UPI001063FC4B|nr:hypothetical protein [Streptomyces bluensis]GGZ61181.1 hypothetical protein GCM10010344_29050 [Streptomyces bluensis]